MHDIRWSNLANGNNTDITAWCLCGWRSETMIAAMSGPTQKSLEKDFLAHLTRTIRGLPPEPPDPGRRTS